MVPVERWKSFLSRESLSYRNMDKGKNFSPGEEYAYNSKNSLRDEFWVFKKKILKKNEQLQANWPKKK